MSNGKPWQRSYCVRINLCVVFLGENPAADILTSPSRGHDVAPDLFDIEADDDLAASDVMAVAAATTSANAGSGLETRYAYQHKF